MHRLVLVAFAALVAAPARADNPLPAAVLDDLKAATVFVKVKAGTVGATGSGFVFRIDGDEALIVTNEHVVDLPKPYDRRPKQYAVVFHGGRGAKEKTLPAALVAADAHRDLAVLRVSGVKGVAKAIDLAKPAEIRETMTVYTIGYPFGAMLATSRGAPAVTIGKGTVSSIREDDKGATALVQIDGDINPGNSGGPVVDEQGRLVGVAVAKITGTRIGLAIPPADVAALLNGRVGGLSTTVVSAADGVAEVAVDMRFIDPLGKVSKAAVRVARKTGPDPTAGPGPRKPLPDAEEFPLAVDAKAQKATGKVKLTGVDSRAVVEFWVQPVYSNGAAADLAASPTVLRVDFSGAVAARPAPAAPAPGMPAAPAPLGGRPGGLFSKPGAAAPASATAVPGPKPTGAAITVTDLGVSGLTGKKVTVGVGAGPACLAWAAGAKSFYHLDAEGTVRRVTYPDFTEAAALAVGSPCNWLAVSAEGVVLTATGRQEMWLLDADTLAVKARVPIAKAKRVAAAPGSSFAYTTEVEIASGTLSVIDLKAGKRVRQYGHLELAENGRVPLDHLVLTPDGKHLLATGGIEQVGRYAVAGESVRLEELSPRLIQGRFEGLCVSPGGEFVCAPSGGGNYGFDGYERPGYGTFVFPVGDLRKPAATLRTGPYPLAVGFDMKAGLMYGQNSGAQLIVMDGEGVKLKEHNLLGGRAYDIRQYLVHPEGKQALILGGADYQNRAKPATLFAVTVP